MLFFWHTAERSLADTPCSGYKISSYSNARGNLPVALDSYTYIATNATTTSLNGALLSVWGCCHTRSGVSRSMDPNQVVSVCEGKEIFQKPRDAPCQHFLQPNAGDTAAVVGATEFFMRPGGFSALAQALDLWQSLACALSPCQQ